MFQAILVSVTFIALAGCAFGPTATAEKAQTQMIGMSKEQVRRCMGPPPFSYTEGSTEVWAYRSDGESAGAAQTSGTGAIAGSSNARDCIVNVMMQDGRVIDLDYRGPAGRSLAKENQCASMVENCVK